MLIDTFHSQLESIVIVTSSGGQIEGGHRNRATRGITVAIFYSSTDH